MSTNEPKGFESGWENLDRHPDLSQRPRPMFDPKGNPVEAAPEPEPLTAAEQAMFVAVEAGVDPGTPVVHGPTGVIVGESAARTAALYGVPAGTVVTAASMTPGTELRKAVKIRELATRALDNPSPAAWAVALSEILRELDA